MASEIREKTGGGIHGLSMWLAFISMLCLYSINYFQRTAIPGGIFSCLQRDMGLTATEIAFMGTSFTCIYSFTQVFCGLAIDRFGGIRVNVIGGLMFAVGTLLFPLAQDKHVMYILRAITGLGASTMFLGLVYEANHLFGRKNYAVAMGFIFFIAYTGGLMASLPFAILLRHFLWRNVLLAVGILAIVSYIVFYFSQRRASRLDPPPKRYEVSPWQSFRESMRNSGTWKASFIGSVIFADYFCVLTVIGKKFLEDFPKMVPESAAKALFCMSLTVMTTSFLSNIISRLCGNRRKPFMVGACILNVCVSIAMTVAILTHAPGIVFGILFCSYALASGFCPVISMSIQELNLKRNHTLVTGFCNMANYLFVAFFAVCAGKLLDLMGVSPEGVYSPRAYRVFFEILVLLGVCALVCALRIPETAGKYILEEK